MDNLLPKNEYKEVEGRYYADPNVALNESNQFIDNLRNVQNQQNQEIAQQTYNLGTDIESVKGGLGTNTTNDLSYFTSRYQVPQTTSAVANLRTAAQAAALNQVLSDEQEMWKNRYQNAYRNYQKRQYNMVSGGTGGTGGTGGDDGDTGDGKLPVDTNSGQQDQKVNTGSGPQKGDLWYENGNTYYITDNGERWSLRNLTGGEPYSLGDWSVTGQWPNGSPMSSGSTYQNENGMYIYVDTPQNGGGSIYKVGDTPWFSYK